MKIQTLLSYFQVIPSIYNLAHNEEIIIVHFQIDLLMFEKELCNMSALHLAQMCAEIALVVIMTCTESASNPLWDHWHRRVLESNPILMEYTCVLLFI